MRKGQLHNVWYLFEKNSYNNNNKKKNLHPAKGTMENY